MLLFALGLLGAVGTAIVASSSSSANAKTTSTKPFIGMATTEKFVRVKPAEAYALAPNGMPFVLSVVTPGRYEPKDVNIAIDAIGQWWSGREIWEHGGVYSSWPPSIDKLSVWDVPTGEWVWEKSRPVDPNDAKSFDEVVAQYMTTVVIPALITAAGAAVGGVAGAALAFALSTTWKIIQGQRVTQAIIDAAAAELPGAIRQTAFYQTYAAVKDAPLTQAAIAAARKAQLDRFLPSQRADAAAGVDQALAIARAQRIQDKLIELVKAKLSADERSWLDIVLGAHVELRSWIGALFGERGLQLLDRLQKQAATAIDGGTAA